MTESREPDLLERWTPDARSVRVSLNWVLRSRSVALLIAVIAIIVLSLRGFSVLDYTLLATLGAVGAFVLFALANTPRQVRAKLARESAFELTSDAVRVRLGIATREMLLCDLDRVIVVPVRRSAFTVRGVREVGHLVLVRRGDIAPPRPSIPSGWKVTRHVTGVSAESVDPQEQLNEGMLTFWYVANPELVRHRIEAAQQGVSAYARGPHR